MQNTSECSMHPWLNIHSIHLKHAQSLYEPPREKNNNLHRQRCRSNYEADQRLCFHYTDSIVTLLLKSEISSFKPVSFTAQTGLCKTCSETTLLVFSRDDSYYIKILFLMHLAQSGLIYVSL